MTEPDTDTDLHAQWRKHAVETPPAALDDAIRATAHRAVHAKPSALRARAPWPTWATFVAAASIGVIAIGVWQLQPRDVDEIRSVTSDAPARPSAAAAAAVPHARAEGAIVAAPAVREELQSSKAADALRMQEVPRQETDRQASPPVDEEKRAVAVARKRDVAADIVVAPSKVVATDRSKTDAAAAALPEAATDRKTEAAAAPEARKPSPFPANDATRADNAASPTAPAQPAGPSPAASAQLAGASPSAFAQLARPPATTPAATAGGSVAAPGVAASPGASRPMLAQAARPAAPSIAGERSTESNVASPAPRGKARSIADYVDTLHRERTEQRESDARATLAAMRAEYADADARLPEDLRAWAAQVAPLQK